MSNHTALLCPQCGGSLPRQALWKLVACPFCAANVTLGANVVEAAHFRAAYLRAHAAPTGARVLRIDGQRFYLRQPLGSGDSADVFLAQRLGPCPEQVVIKVARDDAGAPRLQREFATLQTLQNCDRTGAAYFTTRLPQPICYGEAEGRATLVLRHPTGYWGSLDHVHRNYPQGLDPRHIVWLWRRMLEVLGFLHQLGWGHRNLTLAHALVQPRDHGVLLISYGAGRFADHLHEDSNNRYGDLRQSARMMLSLMPAAAHIRQNWNLAPLDALLRRVCDEAGWLQQQDAHSLDQHLKEAAHAAFGPPRFLHFSPTPQASTL